MKEIDYRTLRRRIILRWLNRALFVVHASYFLFTTSVIDWGVYYNQIALVFWFFVLVAHFLWAFGIVGNFMRRQMEREAERLRAQGYIVHTPAEALEKPKRAARLADDGEIDYEDATFDPDEAHTTRRRTHN